MSKNFKQLWKENKAKDTPWAICTAQVGREDKNKYERCVKDVKKSLDEDKYDDTSGIETIPEPEEYDKVDDNADGELIEPEYETGAPTPTIDSEGGEMKDLDAGSSGEGAPTPTLDSQEEMKISEVHKNKIDRLNSKKEKLMKKKKK